MERVITLSLIAALTLGVASGCATKEQTGAVMGGAVGAAVGSTIGRGEGRTAAIILGTMAGTMVGSTIGRYMDQQDRLHTAQTLEYNRTNESSVWRNPDSGNTYRVTPTRTFETSQGPCREFTLDANVGTRKQQVYGTACRQPDGSWKIVNQQ
jgi:surface antigen